MSNKRLHLPPEIEHRIAGSEAQAMQVTMMHMNVASHLMAKFCQSDMTEHGMQGAANAAFMGASALLSMYGIRFAHKENPPSNEELAS